MPSEATKYKTRHVFVKHRCPRRQQSQNIAKISKSYTLTPHHPQGYVMSVKCEEPIDELTVQVWLVYYHSNFKYCTLFVSGTELRTDGQTNRQTDGGRRTEDPITRGPQRTFQAGCIKTIFITKLKVKVTRPYKRTSLVSMHTKYEVSISYGSKVMTNVNVENRQSGHKTICPPPFPIIRYGGIKSVKFENYMTMANVIWVFCDH